MAAPKRKKPSKNLESASSPPISHVSEPVDPYEVAGMLAQLLIGVNPYLDISFTQLCLVDLLESGLSHEHCAQAGLRIAKEARITINEDRLGDVH